MFILYDLIFLILAVLYLPYQTLRRKWHKGFWMRLGIIPADLRKILNERDNIWIHAVSVGEVLAIEDLIECLQEKFPSCQVVCSTVTKTGYHVAEGRLKNKAVVIFAPLDFSWIIRKFLFLINPRIYICAETEIWPNLYSFLHRNQVPIIQINGRISDKAFEGYKKIKFIAKKILSCVDIFCMQTELDAQRIKELGVEERKIKVIGNLKFDNLPSGVLFSRENLGFNPQDCLWIAGSTHPGEEEIVLKIYQKLSQEFSSLRLILAPRHIERTQEIARLIEQKGLRVSQISAGAAAMQKEDVLLVDTVGQLRGLYGIADIVFVGKSLCGGGGQNIIEPAFWGKPIIVGPWTYNFKDVVRIFLKEKALKEVNNSQDLERAVKELFKNPALGKVMGERARKLVEKYQGATTKTIKIIDEFVSKGKK